MRTGTKEWSDHSKNIQLGCKHGCLYCYARQMAERFGRVEGQKDWVENVKLNAKSVAEKPKKLDGRIMFPTTHDVTEENLADCVRWLSRWLGVGNEVLIVSKPHVACVREMVDKLAPYKDRVTFRFTIGSTDDRVLKFWEPGAPPFEERLACVKLARDAGYRVGVSCEPYLDGTIEELVERLIPLVNDTIWIGLMNQIKLRVKTDGWSDEQMSFLSTVRSNQTRSDVERIYNRFKGEPKVRWKESVKEMLGLPEADGWS